MRRGVRWVALVVAAGALSALGGCTGGSTLEQDQLRGDLDRLSSRLKRIESENSKLSEKIDELQEILKKRARDSARAPRPPPDVGKVEVRERQGPVEPPSRARTPPEKAGGDDFTRKVQEALKKAGLDPGPADGKMGRLTTEALKAFQRDNNLPETGTANAATWELLRRYLPD